MRNVVILEKEPVSVGEVYNIVKTRKDEERNYEQKLVWEHVSKFKKLGARDSKALFEELRAMDLRRLREEYISQIVDLAPSNLKELKSIFADAKSNLHDDELKKVLETVKKYVK